MPGPFGRIEHPDVSFASGKEEDSRGKESSLPDVGSLIDLFLEGPCTPARRKECEKNSGPMVDLLCRECERGRYEPEPYVVNLYRVFLLHRAGFPLQAEDADLTFWMDLALFTHKIDFKLSNCPMTCRGSSHG